MFPSTALRPTRTRKVLENWRAVPTCAAAEPTVLTDCVGELVGVVLGLHAGEIECWGRVDWRGGYCWWEAHGVGSADVVVIVVVTVRL